MSRSGVQPESWWQVRERLAPMLPDTADGLPLGNKKDPYDELIYILLTVMTRSQPRIDRAYDGLRDLAGGRWSGLLEADEEELREILDPLGFVNRRSSQLLDLVRRVHDEHGGSLDFLEHWSNADALAYLTSLPGVGDKTAKCVLMYSLRRDVFPVDIHVLRVVKRLGLVDRDLTWEDAAKELEADVPNELKFDLHVALVIHGREVCKGPNPRCDECDLLDVCPTGPTAERARAEYV